MPAQIVHLLPAVDQFVKLTAKTDSLSSIQNEACRLASEAGSDWRLVRSQLRELQNNKAIGASQKVLLASFERYFLAYHDGYENCHQSYHAALEMIPFASPKAAISLLVSNAQCCASAGQFEQSLGFLIQAMQCVDSHHSDELYWPIFSAAAFCFNRMGLHKQALQYAQQCLFLANRNNDTGDQQTSLFKVINTARLNKLGSLQLVYEQNLKHLERGQLGYNLLSQFLLPVDAALEALDNPQPNCHAAYRNLAIARELIDYANDYGIKQYLLALSQYHLAFGQHKKAKEAIEEAAYLMSDVDVSLTYRIRTIHSQLGLDWSDQDALNLEPANDHSHASFQELSSAAIKNSWAVR